jgi:hypothetical protein
MLQELLNASFNYGSIVATNPVPWSILVTFVVARQMYRRAKSRRR